MRTLTPSAPTFRGHPSWVVCAMALLAIARSIRMESMILVVVGQMSGRAQIPEGYMSLSSCRLSSQPGKRTDGCLQRSHFGEWRHHSSRGSRVSNALSCTVTTTDIPYCTYIALRIVRSVHGLPRTCALDEAFVQTQALLRHQYHFQDSQLALAMLNL